MESNTLIEQLKAAANADGEVTIRFQYPKDWDRAKSFKDGDVKSMHYDLAVIFVGKGIASLESDSTQQDRLPAEETETNISNKKIKKK